MDFRFCAECNTFFLFLPLWSIFRCCFPTFHGKRRNEKYAKFSIPGYKWSCCPRSSDILLPDSSEKPKFWAQRVFCGIEGAWSGLASHLFMVNLKPHEAFRVGTFASLRPYGLWVWHHSQPPLTFYQRIPATQWFILKRRDKSLAMSYLGRNAKAGIFSLRQSAKLFNSCDLAFMWLVCSFLKLHNIKVSKKRNARRDHCCLIKNK